MLLRSQSISYFNVKRTIWLKGYQNSNHIIEPSDQRLQEINIAKNWPRAGFETAAFGFPEIQTGDFQSSGLEIQRPQARIRREVNFSQCLFLAAVVLTALCGCCSGSP